MSRQPHRLQRGPGVSLDIIDLRAVEHPSGILVLVPLTAKRVDPPANQPRRQPAPRRRHRRQDRPPCLRRAEIQRHVRDVDHVVALEAAADDVEPALVHSRGCVVAPLDQARQLRPRARRRVVRRRHRDRGLREGPHEGDGADPAREIDFRALHAHRRAAPRLLRRHGRERRPRVRRGVVDEAVRHRVPDRAVDVWRQAAEDVDPAAHDGDVGVVQREGDGSRGGPSVGSDVVFLVERGGRAGDYGGGDLGDDAGEAVEGVAHGDGAVFLARGEERGEHVPARRCLSGRCGGWRQQEESAEEGAEGAHRVTSSAGWLLI